MKLRTKSGICILLLFLLACSSDKSLNEKGEAGRSDLIVRKDFNVYFNDCQAEGTVAIYSVKDQQWIVSDTVGLEVETLPASTFKIINLLIALETNVIQDENEVVKWVGSTDTVKYGYRPEIYHDMSVRNAFQLSAGWVFIELAKRIGKERYLNYLSKAKYGNNNLSQQDTDFWNFGEFGISPKNQVEFLRSLYEGTLPFSRRNIDIVKDVMLTERTEDYTIHAKTGWTRENGINTGWWTGYIEGKNGTYIFATRLLQDRSLNRTDFGNCRKDITKRVWKDLQIIN